MYIIPLTVFALLLLYFGWRIPKERIPAPAEPEPTDKDLIADMVGGDYQAALKFFGDGIHVLKVIVMKESRRNHSVHKLGVRVLEGRVLNSPFEKSPKMDVRWAEVRTSADEYSVGEFYYCFFGSGTKITQGITELNFESLLEPEVAPIRMTDAKGYLQKRHEINIYLSQEAEE